MPILLIPSKINMKKKWNIENLDACYRQNLNSFMDGFDHAATQRIPQFIEKYRISRVKDAIAPWIVDYESSGVRDQESWKIEDGVANKSFNHQITKSPNHQIVLDLGCGHGWYCFRLIDKWGFQGHITWIDVSEHNISIFNDEIEKCGFQEKLSAKVANAEKLPFNDKTFDTVYSTEALEHIESSEKVFQEASRVLKPGGKLIITTPSGPIHRFWKYYFWLPMKIKRLFVPEKTPDIQKIYDQPISWKQIRNASKDCGLELMHYHKSVLLPHESYIQFFPRFMQKVILFKAKILEFFGPLTNWMGLHHIAMWRKK